MDLITVIIPVYNAEKTLERCLTSVTGQTYKELEILVINDGSADKTEEICDDYAKRDSRIKVFTQENKGVSAARNLGIKNASGKFLAFVDADDYIEEEMMNCLYKMYQEAPHVDLTICNCDAKGYKTFEIQCEKCMLRNQTICSMFGPKSVRGFLCNKLFRTDIIIKYGIRLDETIHMCEDSLFCCQYGVHVRESRYTEQPLYHYIMNLEGATWSEYTRKQFTVIYAFEKMRSILRPLNDHSVNKALDAEYMVTCIRMMKKELKKYRSFHTKEMGELMKGVKSIGWEFLYSDWGWRYKAFYFPLKIFSQFYKEN